MKLRPKTLVRPLKGGFGDLISFNDEDLLLPEPDCAPEVGVPISDEELIPVPEDFSPIRLRQKINPPKRQRPNSMPDPTPTHWVGGDLDLPSDTTGWAAAIALACKQTENVYKWFKQNSVCNYLLNISYG